MFHENHKCISCGKPVPQNLTHCVQCQLPQKNSSLQTGSYGAGVREQVLNVIVRQAMIYGAPWQQIFESPMKANDITVDDVLEAMKAEQTRGQSRPNERRQNGNGPPLSSEALADIAKELSGKTCATSPKNLGDSPAADDLASALTRVMLKHQSHSPESIEAKILGHISADDTLLFEWLKVKLGEHVKIFDSLRSGTLRGSSPNLAQLKDVIARIYARQNLPAPILFNASSPFQYRVMPILLHDYMCELNKVKAQTAMSQSDKSAEFAKTKSAIFQRQKKLLFNGKHNGPIIKELWKSYEAQLRDATISSPGLGENLSSTICRRLLTQLAPELFGRVENHLGVKIKSGLEALGRRRFGNPLNQLKNICRSLQSGPSEELAARIESFYQTRYYKSEEGSKNENVLHVARWHQDVLTNGWGAWELHWMPVLKIGIDLANGQCLDGIPASQNSERYTAEQEQEVADWMELLCGGFGYLFMENACFILSYPEQTLDAARRLHNETSAAISFADGQKAYAWRGAHVPDWVIKRRRMINPLMIDLTQNVETRRILTEVYGWDKYLRSFGTKLVHQDEFGKLYMRNALRRTVNRTGTGDNEPVFAVEVTNSTPESDGSFKKYFLLVPPNMTTARQAVAWTFGLSADDYAPKVES